MNRFVIILLSFYLFNSQVSYAQLSVASDLIGAPLEAVNTGRYQVKKKKRGPANAAETENKTKVEDESISINVKQSKVKSEKLDITEQKESANKPEAEKNKIVSNEQLDSKETAKDLTINDSIKSIFSENNKVVVKEYIKKLGPEDTRLNKLEIDFAPGLFYTDSKSNSSYRDYQGSYPGVSLGANVWLNPMFGLHGNITFSMGADVKGAVQSGERTLSKFESIDISFKLRKSFDETLESKRFEFDILYTDTSMKVPPDDQNRLKLRSSGFGVGITVNNPVNKSLNWRFGGNFYPRIQHVESSSAVTANSGNSSENIRFGLTTGWDYLLSRQNQVLLDLGVTTEKNQFEGQATGVDPVTGVISKNVSVTNSTLFFTFGYRWAR